MSARGGAADPGAVDDATRLARLFLASLREGDIERARIQLAALDDITPKEPRLDIAELEAGHRRGLEAGQ